MIINIRENISNLLNENRELIKSQVSEIYILKPEIGKKLKNIKTGEIYTSFVYLNKLEQKADYIEIDAE